MSDTNRSVRIPSRRTRYSSRGMLTTSRRVRTVMCGAYATRRGKEGRACGVEATSRDFVLVRRGRRSMVGGELFVCHLLARKKVINVATNPNKTEAKLDKVINAWTNIASDKMFGGMTLAQFKTACKPSLDARDELAKLDALYTQWQNRRDNADTLTADFIQKVVNGVKGDPTYGDDCDLYEAMGYIRKSERKSGLTKKKTAPPPEK